MDHQPLTSSSGLAMDSKHLTKTSTPNQALNLKLFWIHGAIQDPNNHKGFVNKYYKDT